MRYTLLSLLCLASACGYQPFSPAATCHVQGFTVYLEKARDCGFYDKVVAEAVQADTVDNAFIDPAVFKAHFPSELSIYVHNIDHQLDDGCAGSGFGSSGCYVWGYNQIETTWDLGSLAHEFLHHAQYLEHASTQDSLTHFRWGSFGTDWPKAPDTKAPYLDGVYGEVYPGSWVDVTERLFRDDNYAFVDTFHPYGD